MKTVTLTPGQLTLAQMGKEIILNTGESLIAMRVPGPKVEWRYLLGRDGVIGHVRYAGEGLDAALRAINATQDEYDNPDW
jgi:hypothetical protein